MASFLNNKYTVAALAVVAIVVIANAVSNMTSSSSSSTNSVATSSTKKDERKSLYTKDDYTATFPPLSVSDSRDSFKPLIASNAPTGSASAASTNIPTVFTGNEPNWAFTGTATLNGVKSALFENSSTGQSEYVHVGQHWKSATCVTISGDNVTLSADNGPTMTLLMQADQLEILAEKAAQNAVPTPPVNPTTQMAPAMNGPIGNGFQLQPQDGNNPPEMSGAQSPPVEMQGQPTRGRRGGGNRNRGRGGRQEIIVSGG